MKRSAIAPRNVGGQSISCDGGMLLLRDADRRLKLLSRIARLITDARSPARCVHDVLSMRRQRVYALAGGYEDLNDHTTLRHDPGVQTAVDRDRDLASAATLCRFENRADREMVRKIQRETVEVFIESYETPPEEVVLDFDGTDSTVHGHQERRHYHGYYGTYCFLPLHVYCGEKLVVSYLRPANRGAGRHAWGVLDMLERRLRAAWPGVRLVFRGDCGFNRHLMMGWSEKRGVKYVMGQGKNPRLMASAEEVVAEAKARYEETGEKQRLFGEVMYKADSWKRQRRVVVKAEYNDKGPNTRFLVTTLEGTPEEVYDQEYCPRGDMESRIKELQLDLFADRMSCHRWYANEFRLLLSGVAYILNGGDPAAWAEGDGVGDGAKRDNPAEAREDRGGDHAEHEAGAVHVVQCVSVSGPVHGGDATPPGGVEPRDHEPRTTSDSG